MLHVKCVIILRESAVACHKAVLSEKGGGGFVIRLPRVLLVEVIRGRYPADGL